MKKIQLIFFISSIFYSNLFFAQENLVISRKGVDGIPITIDISNIDEVFKLYGKGYRLIKHTLLTDFQYDSLGLIFSIDPTDANAIVRRIAIQSPFRGYTKNGIILNKTTMDEVHQMYNDTGCFTGYSYAYCTQDGITFYIKRDPLKNGFDTAETIFKIEINNNNQFGISSRVNYKYNDQPNQEKFGRLLSILNSPQFELKELEMFFSEEKESKSPYAISSPLELKRNLEFGLTQVYKNFLLGKNYYDLVIIMHEGKRVYSTLKAEDKIFYKHSDSEWFQVYLDKRNSIYTDNQHVYENFNALFDVYTFGTFCSIDGTPPAKCLEMLELVNNKDYSELANWLNSINPEVSAYGYMGLFFLNQKGKRIKKNDKNLMDHIGLLDIQLNTCYGCLIGVTDQFKDGLSAKKLKNSYKAFKQLGWLK